jgi:hypothetical protein
MHDVSVGPAGMAVSGAAARLWNLTARHARAMPH